MKNVWSMSPFSPLEKYVIVCSLAENHISRQQEKQAGLEK